MSNQTVRIGMLGAGHIAKVHCNKLKEIDGVELTAISDPLIDRTQAVADQFEIPNVCTSADEVLATGVDAVVVAAPNQHHCELTVKALQAGKHVLLEKPMALNGTQGKEIVAAQRAAGKVVMIAHQMRWDGISQAIKKQYDDGELGKVYNAKTGWWRRCGIPGWGSWFTRMDQSGGGPLIDIGVHMLDLAIYLMGSPKPVSVFGSTYAEFGPRKKGIGGWGTPEWDGVYDVEDLATALIKMDNGATLTLEVSWAVNTDSDQKPFVHLMGTEGGASYYGGAGKFVGQRFGKPFEMEITPGKVDARANLSNHFIDCCRTGKEPISPAVSGLANNLVLDAIYESAKTGKMVEIDWAGV